MPRDRFLYDPDGNVILQAWVSFPGRDEAAMTREELDRTLTWEQVEELRQKHTERLASRNGKPRTL